jgi:hypothetical protein
VILFEALAVNEDIQCSQYDDWTIVAGLQAITVYCLLRVAEQDDEHMNFDLPLIRTMIVRERIPFISCNVSRDCC